MTRHQPFEVYVDGALVASLTLDLYSTNKEILAELRKTQLFSGRKAEFFGSIRDKLDVHTTQGIFSLKNVSQ